MICNGFLNNRYAFCIDSLTLCVAITAAVKEWEKQREQGGGGEASSEEEEEENIYVAAAEDVRECSSVLL